jgi:hypothetical protein
MHSREPLIDYLESITGQRINLAAELSTRLPLYLRDRFRIHSATMFGKTWLLALEMEGHEPYSPGEYGERASALEHHLGKPVVLVIPALDSFTRNRLVRKNIAFIVPSRQVFLPIAFMDLRERQPGRRTTEQGRLTPTAQCLILFHLLRNPVTGKPLQEVARLLGTSAMMISKAKAEIEHAGLCSVPRHGRTRVLEFPTAGKALWEQALPLLSPPDANRHWVSWSVPAHTMILAGMSALSRKTMIQDDKVPTCAVWRRSFKPLMERGTLQTCRSSEDASALLEVWTYDPLVLSDGEAVDPLSLFLSLRDSPDERVQQQLQVLIESIAW